ncbi:MAG TPA: hypothetical protein VHJ76_01805 [Actinomycetota bacterium]|nr:hypothetical protein [Actinomycetota bacterium]
MGTLAQKGKWIGVRALVAAALVAGGSIVVNASESTPATSLISHDAETLFKGLVLRTGPVAKAVYPDQPVTQTMSPVARRFERDLIAQIRKTDPSFFARFERAITSGDHVQVSDAIDDSKRIVRRSFAKVVGADIADLTAASEEKGLHPLHEYTNTYVHVDTNVNTDWQVHQYTNIASNQVLAVQYWLVLYLPPGSDMSYSLQKDLLVDRIVQLLSTK